MARALADWVRRLNEQDMPVFGRTAQAVVSVSQNSSSSASEMAQAVLRDPAMTSRVLRLANSLLYNPAQTRISTVTRAVVLLGFDTIRSMCLSNALIENLAGGAQRAQLAREMARSLHAAVQARALALQRGDEAPEEVFVAALLYRLGDLALWCFDEPHMQEVQRRMEEEGLSAGQAEQAVLGFRLKDLTRELACAWGLNELLQRALGPGGAASERSRAVELGHQVAVTAEQGWGEPALSKLARQCAELTGENPGQAAHALRANARLAADLALAYGAPAVAEIIAAPAAPAAPAAAPEPPPVVPEFPEPDPMLQLQVLRELSGLIQQQADFNLVLEIALEGIYRGIGVDRTVFALLSPDRRLLRAKFALGGPPDLGALRLALDPLKPDIFQHTLNAGQAVWARPEDLTLKGLMVRDPGREACLLAPCVVNGKSIGLFFADRSLSGRALDADAFQAFQLFTAQANLGMEHLSRPRRPRA